MHHPWQRFRGVYCGSILVTTTHRGGSPLLPRWCQEGRGETFPKANFAHRAREPAADSPSPLNGERAGVRGEKIPLASDFSRFTESPEPFLARIGTMNLPARSSPSPPPREERAGEGRLSPRFMERRAVILGCALEPSLFRWNNDPVLERSKNVNCATAFLCCRSRSFFWVVPIFRPAWVLSKPGTAERSAARSVSRPTA